MKKLTFIFLVSIISISCFAQNRSMNQDSTSLVPLDYLQLSPSVVNRSVSSNLGVCGSSTGGTFSSAPTSNLCAAGIASSVYLMGSTFIWSCAGTNSAPTSCSANYAQSGTWGPTQYAGCANAGALPTGSVKTGSCSPKGATIYFQSTYMCPGVPSSANVWIALQQKCQ